MNAFNYSAFVRGESVCYCVCASELRVYCTCLWTLVQAKQCVDKKIQRIPFVSVWPAMDSPPCNVWSFLFDVQSVENIITDKIM